MRIKFQLSILINKKVGPSAPREGRFVALVGLTHIYVYHCIPFYMNSIHTKFQAYILINKKVFKWGGLMPTTRAVKRPKGELTHMCANHFTPYMPTRFLLSIVINKKSGAFGAMLGPFHGPGGVNPHICILLYFVLLTHIYVYHCIPFYMNSIHTKFQAYILMNNILLK